MEQLLHYIWKHKIFPIQELKTTTGQKVEIIDTGLANTNAGPDFFNAKVKLNGVLWVGNVEIHEHSSDWLKHGHHTDAAYDSVILHITSDADIDVYRTDGEPIPQLILPCVPSNWNVSNRKPRNYRSDSNVATPIGRMLFLSLWHAISVSASTEMLLRLGQTGFLYGP